ncbi:MAG: methyltransferase family protein [Candidatus Ranarchaeia archaeon]
MIPIAAAAIAGAMIIAVGGALMLAGMYEFRSLSKISGLESSVLVTRGVYRWSRNPQFLGWYLVLIGLSLIGRSGLAFIFSLAGILLFHLYIVYLEEPYLERVFGESYRAYKAGTPRYIGTRG